jgi:hypothetical protein
MFERRAIGEKRLGVQLLFGKTYAPGAPSVRVAGVDAQNHVADIDGVVEPLGLEVVRALLVPDVNVVGRVGQNRVSKPVGLIESTFGSQAMKPHAASYAFSRGALRAHAFKVQTRAFFGRAQAIPYSRLPTRTTTLLVADGAR